MLDGGGGGRLLGDKPVGWSVLKEELLESKVVGLDVLKEELLEGKAVGSGVLKEELLGGKAVGSGTLKRGLLEDGFSYRRIEEGIEKHELLKGYYHIDTVVPGKASLSMKSSRILDPIHSPFLVLSLFHFSL